MVLNPVQFVFQIVANLGLYGPGVILIREAFVRWKKGWASVLILGAAYGILEEGLDSQHFIIRSQIRSASWVTTATILG